MAKTKFIWAGYGFLIVFVGLCAACGGIPPRQPAPEAALADLSPALPAAAAMTTPPPTTSSVTNTLTARLDRFMRERYPKFSGTILVAQKGNVLISQGYGWAERQNDVPNTSQTKFAIGSMSKAFTAMAIMILQERGQLTVQAPLCQYVTDCPAAWKAITLHHLLTHTSGIRDYTEHLYPQDKGKLCQEYRPEEVLGLFKDLPLGSTPGKYYQYSSSGYFLLGMVIEKVSGESYETFVQKNILDPVGMTASGYDRASTIVKHRAAGYSQIQSQIINAACWDVSLKYAAGGLYSTVGDLYKWDQALYTDQLVSVNTLNTIFTSTVSMPDHPGVYGYGWMMSEQYGHRLIDHGGRVFGFASLLARYPDDQTTIIVLSNLDTTGPDSIGNGLADLVFRNR